MKIRFLAALAFLALASSAFAQNNITVKGSVAVDDCVKFISKFRIQSAGAPCASGGTTLTDSASLRSTLSDEVGTGAAYFVGGALGTPASATGTNFTGIPIGGLTGLGTGVGTALAVNVGSAGAPVLFNGAGGTPSSINLTNGTALPNAGVTGLGSAALVATGTSGATIPLLNAVNTWAVGQKLGTPTSAATTAFASGNLYLSDGNNHKIIAENTAASSTTAGSYVDLISNDGAALASGDRMGTINIAGSESASVVATGAGVRGFTTQTWSSSAHGSRLSFVTTPNASTTLTEGLSIEQNGQVLAPLNAVVTNPQFEVSNSAAQTGIADNSETVLTWNTETNDVGAKFTSNEWCPGWTGGVELSLNVKTVTATFVVGGLVRGTIQKGTTGAETAWTSVDGQAATVTAGPGVHVSFFDVAASTDCYRASVTIDTNATTSTVGANSSFSGRAF